jgi:hypothetical protein
MRYVVLIAAVLMLVHVAARLHAPMPGCQEQADSKPQQVVIARQSSRARARDAVSRCGSHNQPVSASVVVDLEPEDFGQARPSRRR